jgi:hypothetical protein
MSLYGLTIYIFSNLGAKVQIKSECAAISEEKVDLPSFVAP